MSNERQWANRKELGSGSLNNYDPLQGYTVYQFVLVVGGEYIDKYIQAPDMYEAKDILMDQILDDPDIDISEIKIHYEAIPSNDILRKLTGRKRD